MNKAGRRKSEPEGWREVKLGEIAEIITGKTPPTTKKELYGDKYPFITPTDINEASRFCKPSRYLSEQGKNRQISSILPENSICYTCIASIGKICITTEDSFTNQQINALKVYDQTAETLYIFYYLKYLTPKIISIAGGTINKIVNKNLFSSIEISIPPLAEQRAIAEVLSSLDDKIDLLHRQNKILEDMAQTLFRQWCIEEENGKWEKVKLGKICTIMGGGTPKTKVPEHWDGDIPWLTPKDLSGFSGIYISNGERNISELGLKKSSAKLLPENTVLLTTRAPIGYLAISKTEVSTNQGFRSLIPDEKTNTLFLFHLLKQNVEHLKSQSSGTTFGELTGTTLKSLSFLFPPMELMKRFESAVKPLFNKIKSNQRSIYSLMNLRDALLPKLISGKVSVKP